MSISDWTALVCAVFTAIAGVAAAIAALIAWNSVKEIERAREATP